MRLHLRSRVAAAAMPLKDTVDYDMVVTPNLQPETVYLDK